MTPTAVMDVLQVTLLVLVAAGATVVVRTRDRLRLVLVLSAYGLLLAILFFAFQAPDVSLSELSVGAVALPLILFLVIAKIRQREAAQQQDAQDEDTQQQDTHRRDPAHEHTGPRE